MTLNYKTLQRQMESWYLFGAGQVYEENKKLSEIERWIIYLYVEEKYQTWEIAEDTGYSTTRIHNVLREHLRVKV